MVSTQEYGLNSILSSGVPAVDYSTKKREERVQNTSDLVNKTFVRFLYYILIFLKIHKFELLMFITVLSTTTHNKLHVIIRYQ